MSRQWQDRNFECQSQVSTELFSLVSMAEQDLKWYSTFVFLVGTCLSFADPVTDILTLVEFYRGDHKTWFGVGLVFVILPCLCFAFSNFCIHVITSDLDDDRVTCKDCCKGFLLGFNPFLAAFARLRGFIFYVKNFKKIWNGESLDKLETELILDSCKLNSFFEAIFESAPQFIIQLYAMSVQQEPVKIIQMISLPVSLLSLAWTFTVADLTINQDVEMNVKHKVLLFVTRLFQLSSRLFALCYFIVSYKWWSIAVMMVHSCAILLCDLSWYIRKETALEPAMLGMLLPILFFLHWLRDEFTAAMFAENKPCRKEQRKIVLWLSNALFVAENVAMILLFYFSPHSNTWYSLPVTVCVTSLSVIGGTMRVLHYTRLLRSSDHIPLAQKPVQPDQLVQPV